MVADASGCRGLSSLQDDALRRAHLVHGAVLHAVRPQEGYFKVSEPGTISVLDNGRMKFAPSADGKHRQLTFDPSRRTEF